MTPLPPPLTLSKIQLLRFLSIYTSKIATKLHYVAMLRRHVVSNISSVCSTDKLTDEKWRKVIIGALFTLDIQELENLYFLIWDCKIQKDASPSLIDVIALRVVVSWVTKFVFQADAVFCTLWWLVRGRCLLTWRQPSPICQACRRCCKPCTL